MNDPRVVSLTYKIALNPGVDYSEAREFDQETEVGQIKVGSGKVTIFLKDHFASEEQAKEAVAPLIRCWEMDALLSGRDSHWRLELEDSQIIDRSPPQTEPGIINVGGRFKGGISKVSISLDVLKTEYPQPPIEVNFNTESPDFLEMYNRYVGYKSGKESLEGVSYFCLTMIENHLFRGRASAAKGTQIDFEILHQVGNLSSNRGGPLYARKSDGLERDLTDEERRFLENATKAMIRRVGELACDPVQFAHQITLEDLR